MLLPSFVSDHLSWPVVSLTVMGDLPRYPMALMPFRRTLARPQGCLLHGTALSGEEEKVFLLPREILLLVVS
ncbi:MAG: hypothetical protein Ct9H300mP32_0270 [Verrucomicrobiota bacterium]|nr:MAG: hypothetical protein Ct9H300mP32_0270 [Verrucomicrobiota bacterium]